MINPSLIWPPCAFRFKGGAPAIPAPQVYAPPAPPTASNAAAVQASADAKQKALEKEGINSTVLGGQAASGSGSAEGLALLKQGNAAPKNTLLGGG